MHGGPSDGEVGETSFARTVEAWRQDLASKDFEHLSDDERLQTLHAMELLSRTMSAVAVRLQVGFYASQVADQIERGVAPSRAGTAVPDDLALARMTSPYWASRRLTSAKALVNELPHTLAALAVGVIDDYQARLVTEGTACLSVEDRAEVDERLSGALAGASTKEIAATVRALVYEVDPAGYVRRARRAAADRGVSVRPCPDVMGLLSARLPAAEAITCYQALQRHARSVRASGDPRTVQQLMADELFARLTGRSVVDGVDVEVGLVITDAALFAGTSAAADLTGYGPIPAETARELLRPGRERQDDAQTVTDDPSTACDAGERCADFSCERVHGLAVAASADPAAPPPGAPAPTGAAEAANEGPDLAQAAEVWLRRLYTEPATGRLRVREGRRRLFTGALRRLVVARDRSCRNAWCGAPIRHVDHARRFADSGATTEDNGRGLCERCNLARERPRQLDPPPQCYRPPPPLLPVFLRPGGAAQARDPVAATA